MEGVRIKRINELLKKEIGNIILREVFLPDCLVTITEVDTSIGINDARVYISVLPEQKLKEVMSILKKEVYGIQQKINKKLRMRPIPKIIFVSDKRVEKAGRVERLLGELKKK